MAIRMRSRAATGWPEVRDQVVHTMTHAALVMRVLGEYREMPGLSLTLPQAARLWHIEPGTCEAVLTALVAEGFLARTRDGAFVSTTGRES